MITARLEIDADTRATFARTDARQMRRALGKFTRKGSKRALEAVKAATPVRSGRLRASWGQVAFMDRTSGTVGISIEPRTSFGFTDAGGTRRIVTKRRRLKRSQARAVARGASLDRASPWFYAYGIETGQKPRGRLARRAGGALMLNAGFRSGYPTFFRDVADDVVRFVATGLE